MSYFMRSVFLYYFLAVSALAEEPALFKQIDPLVKELSEITGLQPLKKVQPEFIHRDKLKGFLEERMKEAVKPEEIRAEELTLKKFGFIPADFDLKKTTLELLTEQAAAFYDYRKKKLFVLEGGTDEMQKIALVHELAHALADQHFHLEKFIQSGKNDDSATARVAVMEGQAQWLMLEYMARKSGQSLRTNPAMAAVLNRMSDGSGADYGVIGSVPLYLKETLLFPYTGGMMFQQALVLKSGNAAFSEVFRHPPASTQQILHPETYPDRIPLMPPLLPVPNKRKYKLVSEGTVGEIDHKVLLKQFGGDQELAEKWRGGRYRLVEQKRGNYTVLSYVVEWADAEAASKYFEFYRKVLAEKNSKSAVDSETGTRVTGHSDDGRFELELTGSRVTTLEGMR